jgi:hypothetical protein
MRIDDPDFDDRALFFHVLREAFTHVLSFGFPVLIIFLISKLIWWWLATALFVIMVAVMLFATLQILFSIVLTIISVPLTIYEILKGRSGRVREQSWLAATTVVQVVEMLVLGSYVFWLFKALFRFA